MEIESDANLEAVELPVHDLSDAVYNPNDIVRHNVHVDGSKDESSKPNERLIDISGRSPGRSFDFIADIFTLKLSRMIDYILSYLQFHPFVDRIYHS